MVKAILKTCAALLLTATAATQAHAFQIVSVSPQGEVARVRQVMAKFDAAPFDVVLRFAEPNGVALLPVTLRNPLAPQ